MSKTVRNVTHVWLNCFIFCFSIDEKHKNRSNKHRLETVVSILKWRKNNIVCMHSFVGNRRFSSFKRRENNTIPLRAWNNEIASHCCRSILKRANLKSIAMLHFIQKTLTSIRFLSLSSKANNVFLFPLFCFASQYEFPFIYSRPRFLYNFIALIYLICWKAKDSSTVSHLAISAKRNVFLFSFSCSRFLTVLMNKPNNRSWWAKIRMECISTIHSVNWKYTGH